MKIIQYNLCLLLLGITLTVNSAELEIQLYNFPSDGTLVFQVYDTPDSFGDFRAPAQQLNMPANDSGRYIIPEIDAGVIAVVVFHDENENGRMDRNFIGIPKELIGISNNYRPKGPPNFQLASISVGAMETSRQEIEMFQILGKRGQIGVGVGVIGKSSPYLNSNNSSYQVIPAISYLGERLQIFGPNLQFGIFGTGDFRLALSATYRIASYDENDSDVLAGLGDTKSTLMAGLSMIYEWQNGIELEATYRHDVLDKIGGGIAELGLSRGFQFESVRVSPQISMTWMSKKISNHDFGVPDFASTIDRPAYDTGSTVIPGFGISSFVDLSEKWQLILNLKGEVLPNTITNSPIVGDDLIFSGNAILAYVFL